MRHALHALLLHGRVGRPAAQKAANEDARDSENFGNAWRQPRRFDPGRRRAIHAQDLPEIARAFYENNKLESIYIMSNGQIQKRIFPDVTRLLEECPGLNVTVALGIDGLKDQHEKIRQKPGSWDIAIETARQLQAIKKEYKRLDVQTCTCFMNTNQDTISTGTTFEV